MSSRRRPSPRDEFSEILAEVSSTASYDDILRRLAFHRLVARGLESLPERRVTNAEIRRRLEIWQTAS